VSVAVKKISGVDSVKVSLNEGRALIVLKPGNSVQLREIRKAVEEQGFTPKDAKVKAIGDLTGTGERLQFKVGGTNESFSVVQAPNATPPWRNQSGINLLVSGLVAATSSKQPRTIQISKIETAK
jgi:copper chaperone CopZ